LSVLKYAYQSIDITSRWWPVAQRYLGIVEGRVTALGGDPTLVLPDPTGNSINGRRRCPGEQEVKGIISCLEYDRRGRFSGFMLAIKLDDEANTSGNGNSNTALKKHSNSTKPQVSPIRKLAPKKFFRESGAELAELLEKCWRSKIIVKICFHEISPERSCNCEAQSPAPLIQKVVLCEPPKSRAHGGGLDELEIDETETVTVKVWD
jgi:hypothetical protein